MRSFNDIDQQTEWTNDKNFTKKTTETNVEAKIKERSNTD